VPIIVLAFEVGDTSKIVAHLLRWQQHNMVE